MFACCLTFLAYVQLQWLWGSCHLYARAPEMALHCLVLFFGVQMNAFHTNSVSIGSFSSAGFAVSLLKRPSISPSRGPGDVSSSSAAAMNACLHRRVQLPHSCCCPTVVVLLQQSFGCYSSYRSFWLVVLQLLAVLAARGPPTSLSVRGSHKSAVHITQRALQHERPLRLQHHELQLQPALSLHCQRLWGSRQLFHGEVASSRP